METTNASETLQQVLAEAPENVRETVRVAQGQLEAVDREVRRFVKERPLTALAGAVVAGYVVGQILSRRS